MNYSVNIGSLYKNFPPNFKVPSLLHYFGNWLKARAAGSVGYFQVDSERFNDYWIENGSDLHPYFAFFMRDPTGGQIGYWLHDGAATISPPIVIVGSEGELKILGDTLEDFLERLATSQTGAGDLDSRDEDGGEEGVDLTKWLESRTVTKPVHDEQDRPDLENWMQEWGEQQRAWIDKNASLQRIADKLRKFVKPNAEVWETANFDVLLVGTQFKMWHIMMGPQPMPESEIADLESSFRAVREQRAQKIPERGLWLSAYLSVGPEGGANLRCNFMDRPKIRDEFPPIEASDYEIDLRAFPRSKHWALEWLE